MKLVTNLNNLPASKTGSVISIGNFDGIHLAHQYIFSRVIKIAESRALESILISFNGHPKQILSQDSALRLLTTREEKIQLINRYDISRLVLLEFDNNLRNLEPEEFVKKILIDTFQIKYLIVGYDFKFGRNKSGNIETLKSLKNIYNFELEVIEKQTKDDLQINSTTIRSLIKSGDLLNANKLLGRSYKIVGKVLEEFQDNNIIVVTNPNKLIPLNNSYQIILKSESLEIQVPAKLEQIILPDSKLTSFQLCLEKKPDNLNYLIGEGIVVEFIKYV